MNDARRFQIAAILLRTALGAMFVAHALLKYYVFTLPGTVKFFESIGLPGPLAYVTFAGELIGGILLVAGWRTRIVALALTPFLIGATWAHAGNGWLFTAPNGGWEYPLFLTIAALATAVIGDGKADAVAVRRTVGRAPAVGAA